MATSNGSNTSFPNPIYQQVKVWAAEQEAIERQIKAPAPLNDVEKAFLEGFSKSSPSPSPVLDDGKDYVSLLCLYRQSKPLGNKINFVDGIHPSSNAQANPQWTCAVELSETAALEPGIRSFPAAGFGLDVTGCCPPFAKKKDAKQYAAKCAIDWLAKNSLLPSHLLRFVAPQAALPILQGGQPAKRPSEATNGIPSPPSKRKVVAEDDDLPATQRVSMLCQSMSLRPPTYVLTHADPTINSLFNGYPDFGDDEDAFDIPDGLGCVEGVVGRDNARLEMARALLPHIRRMHQERAGEHDAYLASLRS